PTSMVEAVRWRPGSYRFGRSWRLTVSRWDQRLPERTFVLGVEAGPAARAYVLSVDRPGPRVYQDEVGGIPIVLLAPPDAWPLAFDRRVGGRVASFRLAGEEIVDDSGTLWTGEGSEAGGPGDGGRSLDYVPSRVTEWYAWAAAY